MSKQIYSVIKGTGKYIPKQTIPNAWFLDHEFYDEKGKKLDASNEEIIEKFRQITNISERKYLTENQVNSEVSSIAAQRAIDDAGIDKETLDYIIFAHNFGDVKYNNRHSDMVPSLAARVKHTLKIKNPDAVAYDLLFGCPGWVQGMIHANYFIKSGDAKRILVIGADSLSRISDPHDRDSMIYSDGAGATILEAIESDKPVGIISHSSRTDTFNEAFYLWMDKSYKPNHEGNDLYLKMLGRKLYNYALINVPLNVKKSLDKAGLQLTDIKKILIHQANEKMDEAIIKRLFKLYGFNDFDRSIMPMTISWLGNSSVATVPTLLDMMLKHEMKNQKFYKGDHLVFASIGAGSNINSFVYKYQD